MRFYFDTLALAPYRNSPLAGRALTAVLASAVSRSPEIWRIDPDGSRASFVTYGTFAYPDPPGARLVLNVPGVGSMAIADLLTGGVHAVDVGGWGQPERWSPDGGRLA